jgi:cis-3-alkyl-4-acyloxetan-2-one decarboxylase
MHQPIQIAGTDVWLDGEGPHTVVMLHGWPDSPALWDSSVAALKAGYRCVRFHLPGYQLEKPSQPMSVVDTTDLIRTIVDTVSPVQPVTGLPVRLRICCPSPASGGAGDRCRHR